MFADSKSRQKRSDLAARMKHVEINYIYLDHLLTLSSQDFKGNSKILKEKFLKLGHKLLLLVKSTPKNLRKHRNTPLIIN